MSSPPLQQNQLDARENRCKHIEFTLDRLQKKRGAKTAFARGYQPAFSELYLRNDGRRCVHFRAGTDCPPAVSEAAAALFDAERDGMLPDDRFGDLELFMVMVFGFGHRQKKFALINQRVTVH